MAKFLGVKEEELKEKYLEPLEKFHTVRYRPKLLRKENMPYGPCIFLDNNKRCKVHDVKPLQCKTYSRPSGKGVQLNAYFTIRYFLKEEDERSVQEYKAYIKAGGHTIPGIPNHIHQKMKR